MRYAVSQKQCAPYLIANAPSLVSKRRMEMLLLLSLFSHARSLASSDFAPINEIEFRERGRRTCTFAIQIFGLPYRVQPGRFAVTNASPE